MLEEIDEITPKEMTSDELASFIDEIENDDMEYSDAMKESIRRLQQEEIMQNDLLPEEMMTDKAWSNTVRAERNEDGSFKRDAAGRVIYTLKQITYTEKKAEWDHAKAMWDAARKAKQLEIKQRKLEIQKEAINSQFINIYSKLENEHKKLLIKLLTKEYSSIMERCEKYINKRIEKLLKPYIPHMLKVCKARFPESMVKNPGFMYVASKEYGEGKMIWVKPDIPYYFSQGTELEILRENESKFLYAIDKSVVQFHNSRDALAKRELQYAIRLKDVTTFYQLVKKNPFWYDTLIQELKRQADEKANASTK